MPERGAYKSSGERGSIKWNSVARSSSSSLAVCSLLLLLSSLLKYRLCIHVECARSVRAASITALCIYLYAIADAWSLRSAGLQRSLLSCLQCSFVSADLISATSSLFSARARSWFHSAPCVPCVRRRSSILYIIHTFAAGKERLV